MKIGRITEVAPNEIITRSQVRLVFDEETLAGLAQSIREHGVLQPLMVRRDGDALVLVDGERRLRAAKSAGLERVPVIVEEQELDAGEVLQRQLVTNCQRQDLSPIERARAIEQLSTAAGWTASEVAVKLGLSPATVSRSLALLKLPNEVQDRVQSGELPASTAYEIARSGDGAEQARLAAEGGTRDAMSARRKAKKRSEVASDSRRASGKFTAALGGGRTIALSGPGIDSVEAMIVWLEELLSKARKVRPRGIAVTTFMSLLRDEAKAAGEEGA